MFLSLISPGIGQAQTIGTFTWQLAPFCNVLTFTVTLDGSAYRLTGFDDACGATPKVPAAGSVSPNADGSFSFSIFSVTPDGRASHVTSRVVPGSFSGPWTDSGNASGTFQFGVPSPRPGSPRPVPLLPASAIAPGAIGASQANLDELQRRVIGTCPASQFVQQINQDGSVTCGVTAGAGDITAVLPGLALTGGGASGDVTLSVAPLSINSLLLADSSVTGAKLDLPLARTASNAGDLFALTNSGTGRALAASATSTGTAFQATHSGTGNAVAVNVTNVSSGGRGISVTHAGGGFGVFASSAGGTGVEGDTGSISSAGVIGRNPTGEAIVGFSSGGSGIGAVVGRSDGAGFGVRGFNTQNGVGVVGQAGISGGTGIAGRFQNVNGANTANVLEVVTNGSGDLIEASVSGSARFRVTAAGNVQADGTYTSPAADLAEFIEPDEPMGPADVVEISPEPDGRFRLARTASSTAVAGVLTTKPGVLLNAVDERNDISQGPALALAGRVPVKVSAENGVIRPGDLLVASSTPGHAMKAPLTPAPGSVVGKALGMHSEGTGVVMMLVMMR